MVETRGRHVVPGDEPGGISPEQLLQLGVRQTTLPKLNGREAGMTKLQTLLGVELPIIQAPMAGVQGSALAIAVSNAGGLGSLPCALLSLDAMRTELAAIKAQTT